MKIDIQDNLKDIRQQLEKLNDKRFTQDLNQKELEVVEMSIVALREAERIESAKIAGEIVDDMVQRGEKLKDFAKEIRAKVTKINQFQKDVDAVEGVAKAVVRVLAAVIKWT